MATDNSDTIKWAVIATLLTGGGTNALQYFGVTAPAKQERVELQYEQTMASNTMDFLQEELKACSEELRQCWRLCSDHLPPTD
jgi:hypothetical protein